MLNKKPSATKSAKASAPKSAVQRHRKAAGPVTVEKTIEARINSEARINNARTEDIARLAYSLWEARGCQGGSPEEDWFQAEQQLIAKR
jgi:Protein of unknown function (DUF2934)